MFQQKKGMVTEQSFIESTEESNMNSAVKTQKVDLSTRLMTSPTSLSVCCMAPELNNNLLNNVTNSARVPQNIPSKIANLAKKHPQLDRIHLTHFHNGISVNKSTHCSPRPTDSASIKPMCNNLAGCSSMAMIPLKESRPVHEKINPKQLLSPINTFSIEKNI